RPRPRAPRPRLPRRRGSPGGRAPGPDGHGQGPRCGFPHTAGLAHVARSHRVRPRDPCRRPRTLREAPIGPAGPDPAPRRRALTPRRGDGRGRAARPLRRGDGRRDRDGPGQSALARGRPAAREVRIGGGEARRSDPRIGATRVTWGGSAPASSAPTVPRAGPPPFGRTDFQEERMPSIERPLSGPVLTFRLEEERAHVTDPAILGRSGRNARTL